MANRKLASLDQTTSGLLSAYRTRTVSAERRFVLVTVHKTACAEGEDVPHAVAAIVSASLRLGDRLRLGERRAK